MGLEQNNEQHYREVVDKYVNPYANYQMTTRDYLVRPYTVAEAITITLPPVAEAKGRFYSIVAGDITGAFYITIQNKDDSEGWEGDMTLNASGQSMTLYSDGQRWMLRTFNKITVNGYSHTAITVGPAAIGIDLEGAMTTGMDVSGTITTGIDVSGTVTTGMDISGTVTTGIDGSGTITTGIDMSGTVTTGLSLSGTLTTGILFGGTAANNISMSNSPTGSSMLITNVGAEPTGGFIKCGTSAARVVQDVADMKFMAFYFDNGATSGDNRGMYLRQYLTGAGGGGEAARIFTTVEDVAAGTAHGAHISLNWGTSGTLTGLGAAVRATLHIGQSSTWAGGTFAAVMAEIYSDHADADPAGMTSLAFFRAANSGSAQDDVDDDAVLFDLAGFTSGAAKMWYDNQGGAPANVEEWIKIRTPAGIRYLAVYNAVV